MLKFYNSLSNKVENFHSINSSEVKLYTCGPTVYDKAHIGNFRTFLFEDLLKRTLMAFGYKVIHIMNITDVDDKTIIKAKNSGKSLSEITQHYTKLFHNDSLSLNISPADHYPAATKHIGGMIEMIESLIKKEYAYITKDGSVFFKINSFADYGALSNLKMNKMKHSDRVLSDEYNLDSPQDFALWKTSKTEDSGVCWDSPWGKGRPGWHLECSSMSMEYLGDHFDIHCGGIDNKFPHHENEIAQSKCAFGVKFVNFWLHSEFLLVDGGKMSKSLGNVYTIPELFKKGFSAEEIRYVILSVHYRTKLNFTLKKQHEARMAIKRIQSIKLRFKSLAKLKEDSFPNVKINFDKVLSNDLDTPNAIALFFEWVRKSNIDLDGGKLKDKAAAQALNFINYFNSIFKILSEDHDIPEKILNLVGLRKEARSKNDWKRADELRSLIEDKGWLVKDTPDGQKVLHK